MLIFHIFWLVICKMTRIQIRIQLLPFMWIQIRILHFLACHLKTAANPAYSFYVDPDPTFQFEADPHGSGFATLAFTNTVHTGCITASGSKSHQLLAA